MKIMFWIGFAFTLLGAILQYFGVIFDGLNGK